MRHDCERVLYYEKNLGFWSKIWCATCGAPREDHGRYQWKCGERTNRYGIEQALTFRAKRKAADVGGEGEGK